MPSTLRFLFRGAVSARRPDSAREQGMERRFAELVDAHLGAIYRTARRLGTRESDLEDLVQEVVMVLARRLDDIEAGKERAFALGTVARVASEFRRRERRRREDLVAELDGEEYALAPGSAASGERRVEHAEALELLRAGLDAMTEAQRVTFVLFELEELRASEIAAELGVEEAAVVSRLHRARSVMRRTCERHDRGAVATAGEPDQESQP
jgi:RNA polymerase sigma-70 factor, ECF subfamily